MDLGDTPALGQGIQKNQAVPATTFRIHFALHGSVCLLVVDLNKGVVTLTTDPDGNFAPPAWFSALVTTSLVNKLVSSGGRRPQLEMVSHTNLRAAPAAVGCGGRCTTESRPANGSSLT